MDIVKGICEFLENIGLHMTQSEKSQLESASVLQICFAMRQNHHIASDLLKWTKKMKGSELSRVQLAMSV
jgi:hypothetical protein